jgi:hypothetical protein
VMIGNAKALDLFTNSRPTHDVTSLILRDEKEKGDIKRRGRQGTGEREGSPPVVALKSVIDISSAAPRTMVLDSPSLVLFSPLSFLFCGHYDYEDYDIYYSYRLPLTVQSQCI